MINYPFPAASTVASTMPASAASPRLPQRDAEPDGERQLVRGALRAARRGGAKGFALVREQRSFPRAGHAGNEAVEEQVVSRDDELRDVGG